MQSDTRRRIIGVIFPDAEMAKKAILAWKDTEAKLLRQRVGAELLDMAAYPD